MQLINLANNIYLITFHVSQLVPLPGACIIYRARCFFVYVNFVVNSILPDHLVLFYVSI